MGAVQGWGWGLGCPAERDRGDEKLLLVGEQGKDQRRKGFQWAALRAAIQVKERAQVEEGKIRLDPQTGEARLGSGSLLVHLPCDTDTERWALPQLQCSSPQIFPC